MKSINFTPISEVPSFKKKLAVTRGRKCVCGGDIQVNPNFQRLIYLFFPGSFDDIHIF